MGHPRPKYYRLPPVLPEHLRHAVQREGLLFCEERLRGSVKYRDFRAPGRYSSWAMEPTRGAVAVSRQRLLVWLGRGELAGLNINVPRHGEWLGAIRIEADKPDRVVFGYNIGRFRSDCSGTIEVRLRTPSAPGLVHLLRTAG